jgi:hypothetical protein
MRRNREKLRFLLDTQFHELPLIGSGLLKFVIIRVIRVSCLQGRFSSQSLWKAGSLLIKHVELARNLFDNFVSRHKSLVELYCRHRDRVAAFQFFQEFCVFASIRIVHG